MTDTCMTENHIQMRELLSARDNQVLKSSFPGPIGGYTTAEVEATTESARVDGSSFRVRLPPGREIKLTLELSRNVNAPTYAAPWQR